MLFFPQFRTTALFMMLTLVMLVCISHSAFSQPLKQELDAFGSQSMKNVPPERVAKYEQTVMDVSKTGVLESALQKGAQAPDFEIPNAKGSKIALKYLLANGPVVLTFYRGGWCPFCNIQLRALQKALPEFRKYNATLVAISPEMPDSTMKTAERNKLQFEVLSDVGNVVARKYGVMYKLPESLRERMRPMLTQFNTAAANDELPIAATYVITSDGRISYSFVESDYRKRAEPSDIVAHIASLPKATSTK